MPLPDDVQAQVVAAYRDGTPISALLKRFEFSTTTLYKALRAAGIKPGRKLQGRPLDWTEADLARIDELRRAGAGMEAIMAAMHAGGPRVRRALTLLGPTGPDDGADARRTRPDGTVMVRVADNDPMRVMAGPGGWVAERRLVVARALGKPLTVNDRVEHRNGDRTDCRPENLIVKRHTR